MREDRCRCDSPPASSNNWCGGSVVSLLSPKRDVSCLSPCSSARKRKEPYLDDGGSEYGSNEPEEGSNGELHSENNVACLLYEWFNECSSFLESSSGDGWSEESEVKRRRNALG